MKPATGHGMTLGVDRQPGSLETGIDQIVFQ